MRNYRIDESEGVINALKYVASLPDPRRRHIVSLSEVDWSQKVTRRLEYPMIFDDGGRSQSKRKRQDNDCTVKALAIACLVPYDYAYDLLASHGRKSHRGFALPHWLNSQAWCERLSFPGVKGERRMNPATFCQTYTQGRFICRVAKHVFAVVDGVVHDEFENRPDRCIYLAWRIPLDNPITRMIYDDET